MMRTVFAGIILHGTYLLEGSNLMQIIYIYMLFFNDVPFDGALFKVGI